MPTIYPPLSIGAKARLDIFRRVASESLWGRPMTWRDVRFAKLTSSDGLYRVLNDNEPIWYSMNNRDCFRREKYADDVVNLRHGGWYTDVHDDEKARGIIAFLPRGRIIAGYECTADGEKVYFPDIFDDHSDAAHMADEHARVFAESAREQSEKFYEAQKLEYEINDSITRLRECVARRHCKCTAYVRDEISELIEKIRADRDMLATEYKDFI